MVLSGGRKRGVVRLNLQRRKDVELLNGQGSNPESGNKSLSKVEANNRILALIISNELQRMRSDSGSIGKGFVSCMSKTP
jgi:hypothetical protein